MEIENKQGWTIAKLAEVMGLDDSQIRQLLSSGELDGDKLGWTTVELAEAAGLDDSRIRQLLLSGELDGYKLGRDWRVPDSVARQWLAKRGIEVEG